MMDGSDTPPAIRDVNGRFAAGNRGRPLGARGRVSRRVARAILRDFEAHKDELLPRLRRWHVAQYVSLVLRLLPRDGDSGAGGVDLAELDEIETAQLIADVRDALARVDAGGAGLDAVESALAGEGRHNSGAVIIGDLR